MRGRKLSRRAFATGAAALLGASAGAGAAKVAPAKRQVETSLGRLDIPAMPQRVVAIDSRIGLEQALAFDLPLVGYSHSRARSWVPVPASVPFLAAPPDLEQILMLAPDLILCPDSAPNSDWWPLLRLPAIAPVLPSNHRITWQENLTQLGGWLGRPEGAARVVAAHAEAIAAIRVRHRPVIESALFAAVHYDAIKRRLLVRSAGTRYGLVMPAQVLAELGGREVSADRLGPNGEVALDSFGDVLGAVDAILLIDFGDGGPMELAHEPLWQRLPAVRAGRVETVVGNCTFGSLYTARYLARAWDALFARLSA
ncbi:ABC transporter substrate-binding protein [Bosea sp. NPDC003192]|uniref:ABC transporter substrate-binding protein n=1 Tax=Bosea sp. NPDC003192 TaxID=3390551 RepID=UPI003CFDA63E